MVTTNEFSTMQFPSFHYHDPQDNVITIDPIPKKCCGQAFNLRLAYFNHRSNEHDRFSQPHPIFRSGYQCRHMGCSFYTRSVDKVLAHKSTFDHHAFLSDYFGDTILFCTDLLCEVSIKDWRVTSQNGNNKGNTTDIRNRNRADFDAFRHARFTDFTRPIPVFHSSSNLFQVRYTYKYRPFTIIYSRDDPFTNRLVQKFKRAEEHGRVSSQGFSIPIRLTANSAAQEIVVDALTGMAESLGYTVATIGSIASLALSTNWKQATAAVMTLAGILGPTFISFWMKQSNTVKSQGAYSYVPAAVALFILVVFGSNKALDAAGCTMFQKVLGAGFTFSSIAVGHRMFKDIWSEIFPIVYEWLYDSHPDFQAISDNVKGFDELKQMVEVFDKERRYEHIATNAMICDQVSQMEIKMDKVFQECERLRLRTQALPVMTAINLKIREWSKQVTQSGHLNNGPRPEPLVIQLFGASGVGKSTMTNCLMIEIAKGNIEVPDGTTILQQIYVRQPENTYWSGYCGQPIISYDDFGQRTDSASNPNPECMELIRAAGHLPFQVNMAEVENKSRTYLKAKLIVLTSNEKRYNFQSVTHLPAVYRRIDILAEVRQPRKPRFQNDTDAWEVELYNKDAVATGQKMNFKQFVTFCRKRYTEQMQRSQTIIGSLLSAWDEPIIDEPWIDTSVPPPDNKFKGADVVAAIANPGKTLERLMSKGAQSQMFGYFRTTIEEAVAIPDAERTIYEGLLAKWDESSNFGKFMLAAAGMLGVVGVIAGIGYVVAKLGEWVYTLLGFTESTILTPVAYDAMYQDSFVGCLTAVDYKNIHTLWTEMKVLNTKGVNADGNEFEEKVVTYSEGSYDDYNAAALEEFLIKSSGAVISQSGKQAEGNTPKNTSTVRGVSQDANAKDIRKKISAAQYFLAAGTSDNIAGIGTFIRGRTMLVNKHVLEGIFRQGDSIKIFNTKELAKTFTKDSLEIVFHPDKDIDIALVGFPKTHREFTDLVKHFILADDLKFKQTDCALSILTQTYFGSATLQEDLLVDEGTEYERRVAKYFQYRLPTQAGDCGGLMSLINVNVARKICGIHTAGNSNSSVMVGFSTVLSQELILPLLSRIDITNRLELQEVETTGQSECGLAYLGGDVQHLGRIKPVHENNKTTIRKSKIHGVFPVTKRPCVLRDQPTVSPFWKGLQNYTKPLPALTQKQYKNACRVVKMVMLMGACFLSSRVLTMQEAVYGAQEFPTMEPISRNKSAGYPWMLDAQAKGKMKWIPERDQGELHPDLVKAVEHRIRCAEEGIIVPAIFVDTLKDERKSLKRTDPKDPENIKTRVFSACPMDLAICLRMYFGAYHDHLQKNLINNSTSTGLNPYSSSWHVLAETMKVFGNFVADGDYERFDSTQNVGFLSAHFEAAKEWYRIGGATEKEQLVREVLSRNVLFSLHVARGFLYQWNGRLPSGVVGTTFINSSVNLAAFATAWDIAVPDHAGAKNFVDNVKIVTHGDDNLYTVHPEHRNKFSPVEVGAAMETFGMVYTSATKDDALGGFKPIECCTFLKRGFKQMDGFYRAPLDIESCKDMVNWIRKSPDDVEATKANAITSSIELGYTDPSGETTRIIEEALLKAGIHCPLLDSSEVLLSHAKFF